MKTNSWFEVDKEGLAKLLERRGKAFLIHELIQNAWDTNATRVDVTLKNGGNVVRGKAILKIEDNDPDGFKDLRHAFTLFADSEKKGDPQKRGRFNLGEKLVLALCDVAYIGSTTGAVKFNDCGSRTVEPSVRRQEGSLFSAQIRLKKDEVVEVLREVRKLIPPPGVTTTINGEALARREPVARFKCALPTEVADAEGILRRSVRTTEVEVYAPADGETAAIYELGIPVVETGDKYHVNVLQKVPLNVDRDNVTPAYLRQLRTEVLNRVHEQLTEGEASDTWVRDAASDERASSAAVTRVMDLRFGAQRVIHDPSDQEGTKLAMSKGYTVIPPRALSKEEWANVRKYEAALPAGKVTPSPKPHDPDGKPLARVPYDKWTEAMRRVVKYAKGLSWKLLGVTVDVDIVSEVTWPYGATYAPGILTFNLGRLGHDWFERGPAAHVDRLLIHEFGHHFSGDHLSEAYHDALCKLGAALGKLALEDPAFFAMHGRGTHA